MSTKNPQVETTPPTVAADCYRDFGEEVPGHAVAPGDRIKLEGKSWTMRGWCSAVCHLALESDDAERRVFSVHGRYFVTRRLVGSR